MAIGSHGTGRGGTVGDDRTGRSADLGKALSFLSVFGAAGVETDHVNSRRPPCVKVGCEPRRGAEGLNDSYSYFAQARVERFPWSFAPSLLIYYGYGVKGTSR